MTMMTFSQQLNNKLGKMREVHPYQKQRQTTQIRREMEREGKSKTKKKREYYRTRYERKSITKVHFTEEKLI